MKQVFQSHEPESELLRAHIAYYYFHHSDEAGAKQQFYYYPHFKNALSIYRNSEAVLESKLSTVIKCDKPGYVFGYAKLTNEAAKSELHAPFDKIGVVFQPLGINHFISGSLSDYLDTPINVQFDYFRESLSPVLDQVYETADIARKVQLLDAYFLSVFKGFDHEHLKVAIHLLFSSDRKYTVEELAKEVGVSRKTLLRLFRRHLNCSVIDYLKLIRFRRAVDLFQSSEDKTSLTELGYHSRYYDQSEFVNHFRTLTGFNPKSFFKNLSQLGNQGTYWTFD